jgi:hypothetical protein
VLSHGDRYLEGLLTYGAALERLWLQGAAPLAGAEHQGPPSGRRPQRPLLYRDRPALVRRALEAEIMADGGRDRDARGHVDGGI